jgi:uncharacterized membrane protein YqiK
MRLMIKILAVVIKDHAEIEAEEGEAEGEHTKTTKNKVKIFNKNRSTRCNNHHRNLLETIINQIRGIMKQIYQGLPNIKLIKAEMVIKAMLREQL